MPSKLRGKCVLIVGGSSGIGYAVARLAVQEGATILLSSSSKNRLELAKKRLVDVSGGASSIYSFVADMSTLERLEPACIALIADIRAALGTPTGFCLDHIVFTAARAPTPGPLASLTAAALQEAAVIRQWAPAMLAKHVADAMSPSPASSIILTSGSASQKVLGPGWAAVAATCGGVEGLVRALAVELAPVRVNVVAPGTVVTEMWDTVPEPDRSSLLDQFKARHTTGDVGRPDDIAEAYMYLMKDAGSSGVTIHSSSGILLT